MGGARVLPVVGGYHRLDDEGPVPVDPHPGHLGDVDQSLVLRPQDQRHRRIGRNGTRDPSHHASRQVQLDGHVDDVRKI